MASPAAPALFVGSLTPDAATVVGRQVEVRVVFGEEMDPASLTDDAFEVVDGSGPLPGVRSYDVAARQWTWRPFGRLPLGAPLRAVVSTAARATSGARLTNDYAWSFSVVDGQLSPELEFAADDATRSPLVAISSQRLLAALGQTVFELVDGEFGVRAQLPAPIRGLCADTTGGAAALCTPDGRQLQFLRHDGDPRRGWAHMANHDVTDARTLTMRGNGRGDLLARWAGPGLAPGTADVGLAVLHADSAVPDQAYRGATSGAVPTLAGIDGSGRVVAIGLQAAGGASADAVWLQRGPRESRQGLRLPPAAELLAFDCDADGVAYGVYQVPVQGGLELRCARASVDAYLGDDVLHRGGPVTWLTLAVGSRGDAMCLFRTSDAMRTLMAAGFASLTTTWAAPEVLADDIWPFLDGGDAVLAINARGTVFIAYGRRLTNSRIELALRRRFAGGGFAAPMVIATTWVHEFVPRPALAADDDGRAVLVFTTRTSPTGVPRPLRVVWFE
ncbi:MAG: hypothetical protein IPK26_17730 [Planctomycetes bacterium]|nr:hypothetical protein [Planctomycetota bacterium]